MPANERALTQHEETDACAGRHCYSHMVDEPDRPCYIACGECFHVYRSRRELWWANLRVVWGFRHFERPAVTAALVIRWALTRPRDIHTCAHCTHDF